MEIDLSDRGIFWFLFNFSSYFLILFLNYLTNFFFIHDIIFRLAYSCLVYLGLPSSLFLQSSFPEKVKKFSLYIFFPKSHELNSTK
jgi:hypothetical protein